MTDCTARLALADGTVWSCDRETYECCCEPENCDGSCSHWKKGLGFWNDSFPGSYHVVDCKTCRGEGKVPTCRWDDDQHEFYEEGGGCDLHPCDTCDGAGWVDPPLPLGIGSVLEHERQGRFVVTAVDAGMFKVQPSGHPPVSRVDPSDIGPGSPWTVVRRVWPAGDDR